MATQSIAIIDYGMGNLHSVASALSHVAPECDIRIVADADDVAGADRVIFPGVGAIRDCMAEIRSMGFDRAVADYAASGKPLLAICVGMQALMTRSEENGGVDCFDHFKGQVRFFADNPAFLRCRDEAAPSGERLKVPHMGWNQVKQRQSHPLWEGIEDNSRFYFVHSYYVTLQSGLENQLGETHYGIDFCAAVAKDNVVGVQFHPEKSHHAGLRLLRNFVHWSC